MLKVMVTLSASKKDMWINAEHIKTVTPTKDRTSVLVMRDGSILEVSDSAAKLNNIRRRVNR